MEGKRECRGRRRTSVATGILLIAIAVTSLAVTPVIAQPAEVRVNAPEYVDVGATFVVTIDITDVTDLNIAQFDLSFDPDVVKISEIKKGEINGEEFPTFMHRFITEDTNILKAIASFPMGKGVSGSGYLAEIVFKAKGEEGEKSELNLSKGMLGNISAEKISAEWIDAEIRIGEEKEEGEEEEEEEVCEEVTPGSPNITAWNPVEAVVNNTEGESRTFNITVDQIAVISWQINDTEVQTNESTREAVFTNASAVIGTWNVSVIATNTTTGLSDMHTWIWSVTHTPTATVTPTPTQAPGVTPTPEAEIEGTPTPQEKRTAPKEKTTPVPAATSTPKQEVPGFEAVFAIAVMLGLGIVYILQRRR
jgi:hypothetical protein